MFFPKFDFSFYWLVLWDEHCSYRFDSYDKAFAHYEHLISKGHRPVFLFAGMDNVKLHSFGVDENER